MKKGAISNKLVSLVNNNRLLLEYIISMKLKAKKLIKKVKK